MSIAYLGLGSNLGVREAFLAKAEDALKSEGIIVLKHSSIIETEPIGGPPQENYLNCVLKIKTTYDPHELLAVTQKIETELGRKRTIPDGPRTIDIDILLYDDLRISTEELTIPHPRMWGRDFVMQPLKEIEPSISVTDFHANDPKHTQAT